MPSTDAALRAMASQGAGCVVLTLTVGLFINAYSKGGSVVVENKALKRASIGQPTAWSAYACLVLPHKPKAVSEPIIKVATAHVVLLNNSGPPIPMRLEFFRIRERSIRCGLLDLANDGVGVH